MRKKVHNSASGLRRVSPWLLRMPAAVLLAAVLALQAGRIDGFSSTMIYAASWIILLHVLIGEYVFIRYLHAVSRNQQMLDGFAGLLLLSGFFSFHRTALWCAFLAGAFALAVTKYFLIEQRIENPPLRKYAREKILWESPSVCLFSILAVLMDRLPSGSAARRLIEIGILAASALFAFWMIAVRHIYRRAAGACRESKKWY
jgi:hypothetical protein